MTSPHKSLDTRHMLEAWDVPGPVSLARTRRGTNNVTWKVDTPSGSYILRVYQNVGNLSHVAYEHALLRAVANVNLSFSVPKPMLSHTGDDIVRVRWNNCESVASLVPLIPGRHPKPGHHRETQLSGLALGELDNGLSALELPPHLATPFASYKEIRRVHPLVPHPLQALASLDLDSRQRKAFSTLLVDLEAEIANLYASLPRQVIHADMDRSSILINRGRVTGVLDFEFASPDARAMDFAAGLYGFSVSSVGFDIEMNSIKAFARGYAEWVTLELAEIEVLPTLWKLRQVVSVIHRLGRWLQGAASEREVTDRVHGALVMETWIRKHGPELTATVASAMSGTGPSTDRV